MRVSISAFTRAEAVTERLALQGGELGRLMNRITGMTGVPVIVTAIILGRHLGYTLELVSHIECYLDFYGYTQIEGMEPYLNLPGFPDRLKALQC